MKLDAWLRQNHPLAERLRLVERLSQALNAVHDRGEVLAALDPTRIEVGPDLQCDLSAARLGSPEPGYSAPERREGGPPSPDADVYAVGAVAWEVLVGRPCGEFPAPLGDVAPDLPPDLASAVMGCLERSPEWRPRDLTYLAQLSAARQKAERVEPQPAGPVDAARPRPAPPLRTPPSAPVPKPSPPARRRAPDARRRRRQLLVAPAAGAWRTSRPTQGATAPAGFPCHAAVGRPDADLRRSTAPITSTPDARSPTPTPAPPCPPAPTPTPARPTPTPTPHATAHADAHARPCPPRRPRRPDATPAPGPRPTPARVAPSPRPRRLRRPREAAVLTAVSPLSVRRPGKALLDLRGTGLHAGPARPSPAPAGSAAGHRGGAAEVGQRPAW